MEMARKIDKSKDFTLITSSFCVVMWVTASLTGSAAMASGYWGEPSTLSSASYFELGTLSLSLSKSDEYGENDKAQSKGKRLAHHYRRSRRQRRYRRHRRRHRRKHTPLSVEYIELQKKMAVANTWFVTGIITIAGGGLMTLGGLAIAAIGGSILSYIGGVIAAIVVIGLLVAGGGVAMLLYGRHLKQKYQKQLRELTGGGISRAFRPSRFFGSALAPQWTATVQF